MRGGGGPLILLEFAGGPLASSASAEAALELAVASICCAGSAPQAGLARRPDEVEYSPQFGVHLGNPG